MMRIKITIAATIILYTPKTLREFDFLRYLRQKEIAKRPDMKAMIFERVSRPKLLKRYSLVLEETRVFAQTASMRGIETRKE